MEMENALEKYLLKCSSIFYGLTPKATRRLAYEYAQKNSLKIPRNWESNGMAGKDWLWNFLRRHPRLSIRKPEATSLARMTSFNPTNVKTFQDKLETVITRYSFEPMQIFNLDETGVTTVQRVPKIVGKKGEHQIGQATSRERGELVTQVGIISASGTALPPIWVFPRKRFDAKKMMQGVSGSGALGLVHSSGWMTAENFLEVLKHLVKYSKCSVENKILLIMDNHDSHLSLHGLEYCRGNGIVVLTLPPHTSNKLQPLDRTVFGPFKAFLNQGATSWLLMHPAQTLSIYDLPVICLQAWDRAATPTNIKSGFRCTGIMPFDRSIFKQEDFLSCYVTDQPVPSTNNSDLEPQPSTSKGKDSSVTENNASLNEETPSFVLPELILPFPKAKERKNARKATNRGRCMIATDTPEKDEIEARHVKKKGKIDKVTAVKRKIWKNEDSDSDDQNIEDQIEYKDNSSDDELIFSSDEENIDYTKLPNESFIIAKVYGKRSVRNYAARIIKRVNDGYEVNFLKRHIASNRFTMSENDQALVPFSDITSKLPDPISDKRDRFKDMMYFNVDLAEFSLQ